MEWKPIPTYVIRHDPPAETLYPFSHSPPGSPPPLGVSTIPACGQSPTLPRETSLRDNDPMEYSSDVSANTRVPTIFHGNPTHPDSARAPDPVSPVDTLISFLTINAQKVGANSPSLTDIVTMLDDHSPDIIFLTETPLHSRSGALTHVLRNRGYTIHYHPANAPSPTDTLTDARTPGHLTHPGGGYLLAYKKHTTWSPMVKPLILPEDGPKTTTCAVELTLLTRAKAAFIACYLPQPPEDLARVCKALAKLPSLPRYHIPSSSWVATYKVTGIVPTQQPTTLHLSPLRDGTD
jgi:hypothetical protein